MIYFIRAKTSGNVKIGYSIEPNRRKAALQTSHYEDLELIGLMEGTIDDEQRIHRAFARLHIRGEWYRHDVELAHFIEINARRETKNVVTSMGNGRYRVIFAGPLKYTLNLLLQLGTHNIQVLSDREQSMVFGIQGERATLLDWFDSLGQISPENLSELAEAMTD